MRIVAGRAGFVWRQRWTTAVAAGAVAITLAAPFTGLHARDTSPMTHIEHMRSLIQTATVSEVSSPRIPCPGGSGPCP